MIALNLSSPIIPLDLSGDLLEIHGKSLEISLPLRRFRFDKECQGQDIEGVLPYHVVVLAHVQEDSFFIRQLLVLLHAIVNLEPPINTVF